MNGSGDDPIVALIMSIVILVVGIVMLVYRNQIGAMTGYFVRFHRVDTATPGWMLIPFALVTIAGGALMLVMSIKELISGGG